MSLNSTSENGNYSEPFSPVHSDEYSEESISESGANANFNRMIPDTVRRVALACLRCRKQKLKCDGVSPACSRCSKKNLECIYSNEPTGRKNGAKKKSGNAKAISSKDKQPSIQPKERNSSNSSNIHHHQSYHQNHHHSNVSSPNHSTSSSSSNPNSGNSSGNALILPSNYQLDASLTLEQLSDRLKLEIDSYESMAQHWQKQLKLLKQFGPQVFAPSSNDFALSRNGMDLVSKNQNVKRNPSSDEPGRPSYLPQSGTSWRQVSPDTHPALLCIHTVVGLDEKAAVPHTRETLDEDLANNIGCHRFRILRFWQFYGPSQALLEGVTAEALIAAWDLLLQPVKTAIIGNAFLDEIGRPLEDDLEETHLIDSISIFAHTASLDELLTTMTYGCAFYLATQLLEWEEQREHLSVNMDRLFHVAFFQRGMSNQPQLASRSIQFIIWYVWRYKSAKMYGAYRSAMGIAQAALAQHFDYVDASTAYSLCCMLLHMAKTRLEIAHYSQIAERIPHTPRTRALLGLALAIATLSLDQTSPMQVYEDLENSYPELVRAIHCVEEAHEGDRFELLTLAAVLHGETLVRLGRDISLITAMIRSAVTDLVRNKAFGAIHVLFSNMMLVHSSVHTAITFPCGNTCTVADYARIETAKQLGFPMTRMTQELLPELPNTQPVCKLLFEPEVKEALERLVRLGEHTSGACPLSGASSATTSTTGTPFETTVSPHSATTPNAAASSSHFRHSSNSSNQNGGNPKFNMNEAPSIQMMYNGTISNNPITIHNNAISTTSSSDHLVNNHLANVSSSSHSSYFASSPTIHNVSSPEDEQSYNSSSNDQYAVWEQQYTPATFNGTNSSIHGNSLPHSNRNVYYDSMMDDGMMDYPSYDTHIAQSAIDQIWQNQNSQATSTPSSLLASSNAVYGQLPNNLSLSQTIAAEPRMSLTGSSDQMFSGWVENAR